MQPQPTHSNASCDVVILAIKPQASENELAAIKAAYKLLWPGSLHNITIPQPVPQWRYMGRPWRRRSRYSGWSRR